MHALTSDPYCFVSICSRIEMMKLFKRPNMVMAEIGVNRGDFSAEILPTMTPRRLHLIDIWSSPGDVEHVVGHEDFYHLVTSRFKNEPKVDIHRSDSLRAAASFEDQSLDMVYIDADHSYEAVLADLIAYGPKLKPDGVICGHDFVDLEVLRMLKGRTSEDKFGVMEAVSTFSRRFGFKLIALAFETTPSFFLVRQNHPLDALQIGRAAHISGNPGFCVSSRRASSMLVDYFRCNADDQRLRFTPIF